MEEPAWLQSPRAVVNAAAGAWTQELKHPNFQEITCNVSVYSVQLYKGNREESCPLLLYAYKPSSLHNYLNQASNLL